MEQNIGHPHDKSRPPKNHYLAATNQIGNQLGSDGEGRRVDLYRQIAEGLAVSSDKVFEEGNTTHELLEEIWSLESALRFTESRVTQLLVNEERLGLVEELDEQLREEKATNHDNKVKIADLGAQCSKLIRDLGRSEEENQVLVEKIQSQEARDKSYEASIRDLRIALEGEKSEGDERCRLLAGEHSSQIQELEQRFSREHREHEDAMLARHKTVLERDAEHRAEVSKLHLANAEYLQGLRAETQKEREKLIDIQQNELKTVEDDYRRSVSALKETYDREHGERYRVLEKEIESHKMGRESASKGEEEAKANHQKEVDRSKEREKELMAEIEEIRGKLRTAEDRFAGKTRETSELLDKNREEIRGEFLKKMKVGWRNIGRNFARMKVRAR